MKKILITGSKGFVGKHLIDEFKNHFKIVDYDIKDGRDIFDDHLLNRCLNKVDVVIHLAAYVSGVESWEKPEEYFINNGIGTFKVINAAIKNKVDKIIIFSSAAVYGDPLTPYGASKIFAETIAKCYKNKIKIIIVRPFNIYGSGQNPSYGYVIHNFAMGMKKRKEIEIYGTGNQTRDFIHIKDIVKMVKKLIDFDLDNITLDLGTGKSTRILHLAKIISKILDIKYNTKYSESRKELFESRASTSGLKKIGIDTSKFVKLEDGLRELLLK